MDQLWDMITRVPEIKCQDFELDRIFDSRPLEAFRDRNSDELKGRRKLVHQQGLVAQARYVPEPDQPYTGIFKGAEHVLVRLSEAEIFDRELSHGLNPSIALKFLVDGTNSANQFGMVSFEGTSSWDFFATPFRSHVPRFEKECAPKTLLKFFAEATSFIFQTGSDDMA